MKRSSPDTSLQIAAGPNGLLVAGEYSIREDGMEVWHTGSVSIRLDRFQRDPTSPIRVSDLPLSQTTLNLLQAELVAHLMKQRGEDKS